MWVKKNFNTFVKYLYKAEFEICSSTHSHHKKDLCMYYKSEFKKLPI